VSLVHSPPRRVLVAGLALATLLARAAHADIPWPENGAPVCSAPSDQHQLIRGISSCGGLMLLWRNDGLVPADLQQGGVGVEPPTGACPVHDPALTAPGARELTNARLLPTPLGFPGCQSPFPAFAWLQDSPSSEELVAWTSAWSGHERVVVDDGAVTRHHARLQGSGQAWLDTAAVVVWSDDRTGVNQIRAQRVNWSGSREWGEHGLLLAPTGAPQTEPEIARLFDGSSIIAWIDERAGNRDVYALRLMSDGSLAPGWPALGLALEDRPELSSGLRLVGSPFFGSSTIVLWEEEGVRFGGGRQIVARLLDGGGLPDPAWDPAGVPLTDSPTVERLQDVLFEGDGYAAVWTDTRSAAPGNPRDLYVQRAGPSGTPRSGWPASGRALCTAPGTQDHASLSGGGGPLFVAWEDGRGGDLDVYALRLEADGSIPCCEWTANGLPAALAAGDQTTPVVTAGNGGGGFVAWVDARDAATNGLDIYAQAFTGDGRKADVKRGALGHGALLRAPAPNPARGTQLLTVEMASEGPLELDVIDLAGRRVVRLANGQWPAGEQSFRWDGRSGDGGLVPPGVYRVRLRAGGQEESRAVIRIH